MDPPSSTAASSSHHQQQVIQLTPTLQATLEQCSQLFEANCFVKVERCPIPPLNPTANPSVKVEEDSDISSDEDVKLFASSRRPSPPPKNKKTGKGVATNRKSSSCCCTVCRKTFSSKKCLKEHQRKHTGEKRYHCDICGRTFWSRSACAYHKKTRDERNGVCPPEKKRATGIRGPQGSWICGICGKRLKRRSSYLTHLKGHREDKPFKCEECGKEFKQKGALTLHGNIHAKVWQFSCVFCDKGFHQKNNYWSHLRGHTMEKPHFCVVEDCGASFKFARSLKMHRQMIHLKKR